MSSSAFDRLTAARELRQAGKPREAIQWLLPQPEESPILAGFYFLKGLLHQDLGESKHAIDAYKTELLHHPNHVHSHINMGVIYFETGRFAEAIASFKLAVLTGSDQFLPYYNLGNVMRVLGRYKEAVVYYNRALQINPESLDTLTNLSPLYRQLGLTEKARSTYLRIIELDPNNKTAQHFLASLEGARTDRAPQDYVENLFDDYAPEFDHSLTKVLKYNTPRAMARLVAEIGGMPRAAKGLDLGCGTGLGAEALLAHVKDWIGVDLSQKMLNEASKKNLYRDLIKADIVDYLNTAPEQFDFVLCLDTFPYIGEIGPLLNGIKNCLTASGLVAFSTESSDGIDDYRLNESGRYSHAREFVVHTAERLGFSRLRDEETVLRINAGEEVRGALFVFRKPKAAP